MTATLTSFEVMSPPPTHRRSHHPHLDFLPLEQHIVVCDATIEAYLSLVHKSRSWEVKIGGMATRNAAANAEAGPSRPTKIETPSEGSPLNNVEDLDDNKGGVSKNGLSVNEDGEVSKIPAFLTKLYK